MKKVLKFSGIALAVFAALVLVAGILAKVLITPERVKQAVLPKVEQALHRQVRVGDVDISLFSGITLKNLAVRERKADADFLSADEVVLRYRFWPLLLGRVVIDEIRLEGPRIRVERFDDGRFNFSDLTESRKKSVPTPPSPKGRHPIDLLVSDVSISHGEILFLDHKISRHAPFRYTLSELTVRATDISLDRSFPFRLTARINGSTLNLEGQANLGARQGKLAVKLQGLDIMAFAPYFRQKVPGKLMSLKLDLDLEMAGGPGSVTSEGKIGLKDVSLVLNAFKKAPIRDAALSLNYDIKADRASSLLAIKRAEVNFNGILLKLAGRVSRYATQPRVDLSLTFPKLDLRKAVKAVPPGLVKGLENMDPAGTVDADLHLAGPLKAPKELLQNGAVTVTALSANVGGLRPALTGKLDLKGDSLKAKGMVLKVGDNEAHIDLQVSHFLARPIVVSSRIAADSFALDPLLKAAAAPAAGAESQRSASRKVAPKEMGPLNLPVRMSGSLQVKKTLYKGLTIEDFDLLYQLKNNILTVERMTGKVAQGTFNETARVDLGKKGFVYSGRSAVNGVQAQTLVGSLYPKAAGTLFGTLDLNFAYNGRGTRWQAMRKNLSAQGNFLLRKMKLTGAGLAQGLADFLNLNQLRVLRFDRGQGNFRIAHGLIHLSSAFGGSDMRMQPSGTVGLDGSLRLALNAALSPTLTKGWAPKGGFAGVLSDNQGWTQLPINVGGTVRSPRFALDTAAVEKNLKQRAKKELLKKLEEKLLRKSPANGSAPQGQQAPGRNLLENAVKGLFGK